ncbi:MAG TPA: hypothetical protein VEZ12_19475, partial [Herpetosiphonaceae bacterium]|nr:hypothetical protein [Herpetosiphonaceae bacterium]
RAFAHTTEAGVAALLSATSESRAPTRCGTRCADSTQLLTLVGGAASFVLVEKSRPALDGRRLALLWG